ncbi:hypothetical protein EDC04DRAFT_2583375 [Pisolithus marmoratus]|nr:hypothetical protein EDC04DRAFT_2583375 [Pisolithus marmoratus]
MDHLHVSKDLCSLLSQNSWKKMRQWQWWSSTTIPSLIEPYLAYWYSVLILMVSFACTYFLSLLSFMSGLKTVDLMVCPCVPTAVQLIWMGFFPCVPLGPTLAISLPVLSLVRQLFMYTPLNISAWSESFEAYLGGIGYKVDIKVLLIACILSYSHIL